MIDKAGTAGMKSDLVTEIPANHSRIPSPSDYSESSHWLNFGVRFS